MYEKGSEECLDEIVKTKKLMTFESTETRQNVKVMRLGAELY